MLNLRNEQRMVHLSSSRAPNAIIRSLFKPPCGRASCADVRARNLRIMHRHAPVWQRFTQQACSPRKARRKPMGRCSQVQCYCSVDANVACLIRCCSPVPTNVASLHTCQDPHQKSQLGAARRHPRNIPHTLMNTVDAADAAQAGRHVLHCLQGPTDSASACTIVL